MSEEGMAPAPARLQVATLKRPTAWIPLAMSLAAVALPFGYTAMFGADPPGDEGTGAHLWQLLMAGQLPIIAIFAFTWLPRRPAQALVVLALQAIALLAAAAPVFLLRL